MGQDTTTTTTVSTTNKWMKNLSIMPLTKAQEHLLAHGPNFTIALKCPPNADYIAVVEQVCQKLTQGGQINFEQKSRLF